MSPNYATSLRQGLIRVSSCNDNDNNKKFTAILLIIQAVTLP